MIPIDRTQIEVWGQKFDAKGNFPKLVAKLIIETTPKSTFLQVPSGSAVYIGGWDGIVKCAEETNYVPIGISLWEIGTNGDRTKANADYKKRSEDSLGFEKREATYIFLTTNIWADKNDWVTEKSKDKIWGQIKVYDSRDIAEWLENSQVSSRWFLILSRNYPFDGIYIAEEYWKMLSFGPKGQILPKIVTAGREHECQQLFDFLSGEPALKAVRGFTKDEAIAFIIAASLQFDPRMKELFLSRSVVVDTLHNFHGIRINRNSLNLIAKLDDTGTLYVAVSDGHHVLVPLGPDDSFHSQDIITLPRIDRDGQVDALIEMGLSRDDASRYSKESGRDYTILKKLLGFPPPKINWINQEETMELIPALLIGRWDETKKGDRETLEKISNEDYNTYSARLIKWLGVETPPLIKIGNTWRLTSPLDTWTNFSNKITEQDFKNLKGTFLNVLREIDPVFDLDPTERSFAPIRGKESEYSSWCREGLTQSLILVGLYGSNFTFQHNFSTQEWVDTIIRELLYDAPGKLWASLNHEMPLLAEASPKSFFESAYHSLSLDDKPIMDMFIEEDSLVSPTSRHTGLLWALEGLAWIPEYFFHATSLLSKLSALDPGGNLANRPFNSLIEIFKPWHYQTLAAFEDRMAVLEEIVKKEYEIGWKLLSKMIPKGPGSAFPTHKLRWRLFERSFDKKYTWREIWDTHSKVIGLLLQYFDFSETKLTVLLDISESKALTPETHDQIMGFVESNLQKINHRDFSAWNALRNTLSEHRSHHEANWALPEDELIKYEAIYKKLEPSDTIEKIIWMFDNHWPSFPEGIDRKELTFKERENLVTERRVEGLKSIYQEFGFEKIKSLVKSIKEPMIYGDILAHIIDEQDAIISLCDYLREEGTALPFIQQFIYRKSIIEGIDWVMNLFEILKTHGFNDKQLAAIFVPIQQSRRVWDFIENTNVEIQRSYWEQIYPHFWDMAIEDRLYGIDKLIEVNRFISALDICHHNSSELSSAKLIEVLEKTATNFSKEARRFESYNATEIIENLETREDIQRDVLIRIEWLYLPFLASFGSIHKPNLLHEELANNPEFLIDVLKLVYKSDIEEEGFEDPTDDYSRTRARNAYDLLSSWKRIPGVDASGKIDEDFLWNWITKVRELASKNGRLQIADMQIGQIIAEYPEDIDIWPPEEFCKVIETINTASLISGFSTATFNKRGSSSRGPFDGGTIERGHAEFFHLKAKKINYTFPKTSEILTQIAIVFEKDAKMMDDMAERDKLEY